MLILNFLDHLCEFSFLLVVNLTPIFLQHAGLAESQLAIIIEQMLPADLGRGSNFINFCSLRVIFFLLQQHRQC